MKRTNKVPPSRSLQCRFPNLAREWLQTKNGDLTPSDVSCGSYKKVWWQCEKGHEWAARISHRTSGKACPYCFGLRTLKGPNCLATTHPELATQWHPTKNGALTPYNVTYGSSRKVWWRCENGHEWICVINRRTKGYGCPRCAKEKKRAHKCVPLDLLVASPKLEIACLEDSLFATERCVERKQPIASRTERTRIGGCEGVDVEMQTLDQQPERNLPPPKELSF